MQIKEIGVYSYKVSTSNPEGIDWCMDLAHEKKFTSDEFNAIVEDAIVHALEKEAKKEEYAFASFVDIEFVQEYLISQGFVLCTYDQWYDYDPLTGIPTTNNEKLNQWTNNIGKDTLPDYLRKAE
jgi:hypothetical protein